MADLEDDLLPRLAAEGRRRCGSVLPEGFTITRYKNGRAWGRWWGGDVRGDPEYVEDWLFICALNGDVPRAIDKAAADG